MLVLVLVLVLVQGKPGPTTHGSTMVHSLSLVRCSLAHRTLVEYLSPIDRVTRHWHRETRFFRKTV